MSSGKPFVWGCNTAQSFQRRVKFGFSRSLTSVCYNTRLTWTSEAKDIKRMFLLCCYLLSTLHKTVWTRRLMTQNRIQINQKWVPIRMLRDIFMFFSWQLVLPASLDPSLLDFIFQPELPAAEEDVRAAFKFGTIQMKLKMNQQCNSGVQFMKYFFLSLPFNHQLELAHLWWRL